MNFLTVILSKNSIHHSENKNVIQLALSENEVETAVHKSSMAQQPEPRFKTA